MAKQMPVLTRTLRHSVEALLACLVCVGICRLAVAAEAPTQETPRPRPVTLQVQELKQQATVFEPTVPSPTAAASTEPAARSLLPGPFVRRPAVVVLHPGFSGDDATSAAIAAALASRGVVTILPTYRGESRGLDGERSDGRIEFCSGEVDDAQEAVEFLRARPDVDPLRIGLVGMSHGGCIALRTALREPRLRAVVTISAPVAAEAVFAHLEAQPYGFFLYNGILAEQLRRYVGGSPDLVPARFAVRSPLFLAGKLTMPLLILHGGADHVVPTEQACWLAEVLRQSGRDVPERFIGRDGRTPPAPAARASGLCARRGAAAPPASNPPARRPAPSCGSSRGRTMSSSRRRPGAPCRRRPWSFCSRSSCPKSLEPPPRRLPTPRWPSTCILLCTQSQIRSLAPHRQRATVGGLAMRFAGVDVQRGGSQICILDEQGRLVKEQSLRMARERLLEALLPHAPLRVLLQAGPDSEWLAGALEAAGHEVMVADQSGSGGYPAVSRTQKPDRLDARALAEACRTGNYAPASRTPRELRELRKLLNVRRTLLSLRTVCIKQTQEILRGEGLRLVVDADSFVPRLERLPAPEWLRPILEPLKLTLLTLNAQLLLVEQRIAEKRSQAGGSEPPG